MTSHAFLNNEWMPLEEARISPLDRGFLFGDGIYEVIPVHHTKPVALRSHLKRLNHGLDAISISVEKTEEEWADLITQVIEKNNDPNAPYIGIYLHVSRGADTRRHHAFPHNVEPTIFAFSFEIPEPPKQDKHQVSGLHVGLSEDLRWRRCHIKSTSLLGNVMHYQQGAGKGLAETILYNQDGDVTEASSCNVFIVRDNHVITPPLDNQLLPGITRELVIKAIKGHTDLVLEERVIPKQELLTADEVWLTSSTKEIAPVCVIDGKTIGDGKIGDVWERAIKALSEVKFDQ